MLVELYGRSYGGGILKIQVFELEQLPMIDPSQLINSERIKLANNFETLANATSKRIKYKNALEQSKSKSKKIMGLFQDQYMGMLKQSLNEEKKAQSDLDDTIYDILNLSKAERIEAMNGVKDLQMLGRGGLGLS